MGEARIQRIKEIFAAEQESPARARKLGDIPQSYELIDASWLEAVIGRRVPGSKLASFELGRKSTKGSRHLR
jgi:hypothetical protein